MQNASKANLSEMQRLLEIMTQLRDPQSGCPWDVKQTMESLTRYTIEAVSYTHLTLPTILLV